MFPTPLAKLIQSARSVDIVVDNPIRPCFSYTESSPVVRRRRPSLSRKKRRVASYPPASGSSGTICRWGASISPASPAPQPIVPQSVELPTSSPVGQGRFNAGSANVVLMSADSMLYRDFDDDYDSDVDDSENDDAAFPFPQGRSPQQAIRSPLVLSKDFSKHPSSPLFSRWDSTPSPLKKSTSMMRTAAGSPSLLSLKKACAAQAVQQLTQPVRRSAAPSFLSSSPPKKPLRKYSHDEDYGSSSTQETADLLDQALRITGGDDYKVNADSPMSTSSLLDRKSTAPLPTVPFRC